MNESRAPKEVTPANQKKSLKLRYDMTMEPSKIEWSRCRRLQNLDEYIQIGKTAHEITVHHERPRPTMSRKKELNLCTTCERIQEHRQGASLKRGGGSDF